MNFYTNTNFPFILRCFLIVLCCTVSLSISAEFKINCEKSDNENECLIKNVNISNKDVTINFSTNSESFRDSIKQINITDSFFVKFPSQIFLAYKNLNKLFFLRGHITKFEENSFTNAGNLKQLDFHNFDQAILLTNSFFNGAENLEELDICVSTIENLPSGLLEKLPKLKSVEFKYDKIKNVDKAAFTYLRDLETVKLSGNELKTIDSTIFVNNKKLKTLILKKNQLTEIFESIKELKELTELDISKNQFKNLEKYPESIEKLSINENQLTKLTINKNVIHLNATNNKITEIVVPDDNKIKNLTLSGNNLKDITVITKLTKLEILKIDSNPLNQIPEGFFKNNLNLRELNVTNSGIIVDCRHFGPTNVIERLINVGKVDTSKNFECFKLLKKN